MTNKESVAKENGFWHGFLSSYVVKELIYKTDNLDTKKFYGVKSSQILTLIERDDGNKTYKTLEMEAGLPCI